MTSRRLTRTYLDAGVLIAAFSPKDQISSDVALDLITDPTREIVASGALRLELLPSAINVGARAELTFLNNFFESAETYVEMDEDLIEQAIREAARVNGIGALDALHITAAKAAGATEFITTERPTKPVYRVRGIRVVDFYSL